MIVKVESLPSNLGSINHSNNSDEDSQAGKPKKENWWSVTFQIFIPFMIAGMGTIGAGLVLGSVEVMTQVNFI